MKKALVTGGAGFIGSHIVDRLVFEGWEVTIFDDFSTGSPFNLTRSAVHIKVVYGNISNYDEVYEAAKGKDCIWHLAAQVSVRESVAYPEKTHNINVVGTENVFKAAAELGIKHVVFSSSCSVYGSNENGAMKETDATNPLSPYAESKLAGEKIAQKYADKHGIAAICLRYFNVYGPRQAADSQYASVVPKFVSCVMKKESPTIFGDGEQSRDFVFVSDVVEANILAAHKHEFGIYNVGTGTATTVNSLWKVVQREYHREIPALHVEAKAGEARHALADISHSQQRLKFKAHVDLSHGIRRTIFTY